MPAATALQAGCEGVSAINTITSVMGVNLDTLRPEPCVEGYSTPGGYSSKAVRPIALAKVPSPTHTSDPVLTMPSCTLLSGGWYLACWPILYFCMVGVSCFVWPWILLPVWALG